MKETVDIPKTNQTVVINTFKFNSKIVGSTFIPGGQEALKALSIGQVLFLVREPDNEYDPNAIAIYNGNVHLGYLPKDTAAKINKDVADGLVQCEVAELTGGTAGKENRGCNILITIKRENDRV